ncbi:MAG: TetR family transcriptional regulator [Myxococcota bacterium]
MSETTVRRAPGQKRSRALVDAILNATAKLLGRDGVDNMSMTAIAAAAGLSKAAIYRYFPNKAVVLRELALRSMAESRRIVDAATLVPSEEIPETAEANLRTYLESFRSEPYRAQLRAAIRANPELCKTDLSETRDNARRIAARLAGVAPFEGAELELRALLMLELTDGCIRLITMLDDAEADAIVDGFCKLCLGYLTGKPERNS